MEGAITIATRIFQGKQSTGYVSRLHQQSILSSRKRKGGKSGTDCCRTRFFTCIRSHDILTHWSPFKLSFGCQLQITMPLLPFNCDPQLTDTSLICWHNARAKNGYKNINRHHRARNLLRFKLGIIVLLKFDHGRQWSKTNGTIGPG